MRLYQGRPQLRTNRRGRKRIKVPEKEEEFVRMGLFQTRIILVCRQYLYVRK